MTDASSSRNVYAAIAACFLIGNLGLYTIPLFVEPLLSAYRVTESGIGVAVGAGALGMVISTVIMSWRGGNSTKKSSAIFAILLILSGQALVAYQYSFPLLLVGRLISGMGEGVALAFAYRSGASLEKPERAYGIAQLVVGIVTVAALTGFPIVIETWGLVGGISAHCAIIIMAGLIVLLLPHNRAEVVELTKQITVDFDHKLLGFGLLVAFALFASSDVSTWVFVEKIGLRVGLSAQQLGNYLGIAVAFGLLGPLFAIFVHTKFGRHMPLALGTVVLLSAIAGLHIAETPLLFFVALLPLNFGFMFMTPYLLGCLAAADKGGGWVTLSASTNALTAIFAPPAAGMIVEICGVNAMSMWAFIFVFTGFLINVTALRSRALQSVTPVTN